MKNIFTFLAFLLFFASCSSVNEETNSTHFYKLDEKKSKVSFANKLIENDTLNYFKFPYLYLGAGVSVGDINNDGLPDLYFTGNLTKNKLYLNKGNLQFEDITESAGMSGDNRWYSGTTMVDINHDGFLDIYLSVSGKFTTTKNQLFINNGDNTFTEKAASYGIDDAGISIQSTFFDYDNDGLLDLFVANYPNVPVSMGNSYYRSKMDANLIEDSGQLYKNNGDDTFTNVTEKAGVKNFGLTLGLVASDFNNDGFKDLYLSNDFNVPDYLYQNNGDGTFTEIIQKATKHTSMFGMGIDASDFNNDGLTDLLQVDMTAEDYKRSKTNMASMSPSTFYNAIKLGLHYQYMQNSLQFNNGVNSDGHPVFSDISRYAGLATTDWSWGALFADFDNDGYKDAFITNGIKRDVNNNDLNEAFKTEALFGEKKAKAYNLLPSTPIANYAFKNNGDFSFSNKTKDWGLDEKGFSNGFTYADLDNDGDLDIIINNIDQPASIFINEANTSRNYLKIKLKGTPSNPFAIGAKITVHTNKTSQTQEITLTRGYQSSVEPISHFGLGKEHTIETIEITWADGNQQILNTITANQTLEITYQKNLTNNKNTSAFAYQEISKELNVDFKHQEDSYNDFENEPLLPHKYSQLGEALAVGDINNDGLEDFFVGNAKNSMAKMYSQNENGSFAVVSGPWELDLDFEDTAALLFDVDNDGDLDLYVVSGGNPDKRTENLFQDRLYINTEKGFIKTTNALPKITGSGVAITQADYDNDGDLDVFIGGRIVPGNYPYPAKSYILQNQGKKNEQVKFIDVTETVAPELLKAGLVTSALWNDFNADGNIDLIITGEWMPIRIFKNTGTKLKEITSNSGLQNTTGWWYGLQKIDIDQDGDLDYVAGNLGLNYKYKTNQKVSFEVYANDFDENGKSDIVLSYDKKGTKLPLRGRECSSQQIPAIKHRFKTYKSFSEANLDDIYGERMLKESLHYKINTFAHHWIENLGNETFKIHKLPNESQFSSINKFQQIDYNHDAYPDLIAVGNLHNSEVETPRNDASLGIILIGNGKGFDAITAKESHLFLDGEIKNIAPIKLKHKQTGYILLRNNETLQIIKKNE
ncbi:VCBS repeat-containing protein [Flavicella sediminum]|uniref:VCBS repeat-containing protein n=1 Tax=Flavicella sediminum TaxID=2585141 RepID=UPI00112219C9|nr:VCBS repeat-containing protein [Flavicella sediminum]